MMGKIVVGVDGSPTGQAALAWAKGEAKLRGCSLDVVHAWEYPYQGPRTTVTEPRELMELDAAKELQAAFRGLDLEADDGLEVHHELLEGNAAKVLINASNDADLVVVGSRGRGGFTSLLLGSTSHAVVQHAHCPVTVVPAPVAVG